MCVCARGQCGRLGYGDKDFGLKGENGVEVFLAVQAVVGRFAGGAGMVAVCVCIVVIFCLEW